MTAKAGDFIWDPEKEIINMRKHGVDFSSVWEKCAEMF